MFKIYLCDITKIIIWIWNQLSILGQANRFNNRSKKLISLVFYFISYHDEKTKMIRPLDILELLYTIINLSDLKSLGRMVHLNHTFRIFKDMPIYRELRICLNFIEHESILYTINCIMCEKIFISGCVNAC